MNKDYVRKSPVAQYIDGFLEEKRSLGYSYEFEEYLLNVFDNYCVEGGLTDPGFSRQFLEEWIKARAGESSSYHSQRISFVKQLALYMNSLGIHAHVPTENVRKEISIPHFLSSEERIAFFKSLDEFTPRTACPYAWRMWNEYRVIFRLIYSCGLRNSEACLLKCEDVDSSRNSIFIRHSKGDRDRVVYLADDMSDLLVLYRKYILQTVGSEPEWLFPSRDLSKPVHKSTLDTRFNQAWGRTPYAESCGRKPTVHCLRHSFVVDRMNAWMNEKLSFDQMMPYLIKQLGHSGLEETLYYYHLNEEANIIIRRKDRIAGRVIPGVDKYGN